MVLTEQQIIAYLEKPQAKDLLDRARQTSEELKKYITGYDLDKELEGMDYFNDEMAEDVRKKLTRSTKDLAVRLLKPLEKVFSATGGVRYYNLTTTQNQDFGDRIMTDVRFGMGMPEWVQNVALWAKLLDPMSLTYDEIDINGNCYPTYKSTCNIHDYGLNGRKPEYVIFTLTDAEKALVVSSGLVPAEKAKGDVYRIVDDAAMYIFYKDGKDWKNAYSERNYFGYVPALISSDNREFNSDYYYSELETVLELFKEFYNDNSAKALFKKYAMYPQGWNISQECRRCSGTGQIEGKDCKHCKGTGWYCPKKVSDRVLVGVSEDGKANIPTPPAGWVEIGQSTWGMMTQELTNLSLDAHDTFWSTNKQRKTQGPTRAKMMT